MLGDLHAYAHREPVQAMAIAVGAGLLVNLLPRRVVAGAISSLGAAVVSPTLLALGVAKALEMCCQERSGRAAPLFLNSVPPEGGSVDEATVSARPSQWVKS